ncbi:hypothetical protein CPB86DRAFT_839278 [Serendipita vermifera]|nr:hypothetical protein CPB86DRAFT_839278 [Serendipita vermifera]
MPPPDIIVVLGNTGCGKSTFINTATCSTQMAVSAKMRSCTMKVAATRPFNVNGRAVILLDTPGFNDTQGGSFQEIMTSIRRYLKQQSRQNTLKGIIFLHAIDETRAINSTVSDIKRQFREICENEIQYALVVATTMWNTQQDIALLLGRERELMTDESFFKIFTDAKSKTSISRRRVQVYARRVIMHGEDEQLRIPRRVHTQPSLPL